MFTIDWSICAQQQVHKNVNYIHNIETQTHTRLQTGARCVNYNPSNFIRLISLMVLIITDWVSQHWQWGRTTVSPGHTPPTIQSQLYPPYWQISRQADPNMEQSQDRALVSHKAGVENTPTATATIPELLA